MGYTLPWIMLARLRRLQPLLADNKLDFLLVTHLPNVRYLSGFTGSAAALLVSAEEGDVLFTDGRYIAQAKEEVKGASIVIASKSPVVAAAEWLAAQRRRSGTRPPCSALRRNR